MTSTPIDFEQFQRVDLRVGKIVAVELLPNPKYTTHKVTIDFGEEIGQKISGARLINYSLAELKNRLIIGVVNLQPRQIGTLMSEVLILGVPDEQHECILLKPTDPDRAMVGSKVY